MRYATLAIKGNINERKEGSIVLSIELPLAATRITRRFNVCREHLSLARWILVFSYRLGNRSTEVLTFDFKKSWTRVERRDNAAESAWKESRRRSRRFMTLCFGSRTSDRGIYREVRGQRWSRGVQTDNRLGAKSSAALPRNLSRCSEFSVSVVGRAIPTDENKVSRARMGTDTLILRAYQLVDSRLPYLYTKHSAETAGQTTLTSRRKHE